MPAFCEDESYYSDWGADGEFSTAHMGHGECSAGIYDMIEVAMNNIKECIARKDGNTGKTEVFDAGRTTRELVYNAAGMLLVTRGIDPATDLDIYREFEKNFIDTGLVDEQFRSLVRAVLQNDLPVLAGQVEQAEALGLAMIQLYHRMDNRLRFSSESDDSDALLCGVEATAVENMVVTDLRGVICPMNFVKTKVALARIHAGERIEILLDDGEPIDNVPRSVKSEGHEIISRERSGSHWSVVIEKKE